MNLDPQIAPLIEALDAGFPPVHTMTGAQARATIRSRFVPPAKLEPVTEVRDESISGPGGDIAVRIYRPDGDLPILVYAHGGGFAFCDLETHDGLLRPSSIGQVSIGRAATEVAAVPPIFASTGP